MWDLIIVGSGPAGLTAGIYAARYKLKTLIIGKGLGGAASEASKIENWPGIKEISGLDLMNTFKEHVSSFGVKVVPENVVDIRGAKVFEVETEANKRFKSKTVILALGTERRKLNIPGEDEFLGRGVSYCAVCDAPLFRGKTVAVIGGRNAAAMAALLLAQYADKVYIIYRRAKLRCDPIFCDRIKNKKIEVVYNALPKEVLGDALVRSLIIDKKGKGQKIKLDGVFVEIGSIPSTDLTKKLKLKLYKEGFIVVKEDMSTNVRGVFAAGDITTGSSKLRQIVTAAAEGAIAADSVFNYLQKC